jgi:hypothetical protein
VNHVRDAWRWLADEPHHRQGIRIVQITIGLVLLYRLLTEAPFAAYLWGPNGVGYGSTGWVLGPLLGGLLDHVYASEISIYAILLVQAVAAVALILGHRTRLAIVLALATVFLLEQRLPTFTDGGDNVMRLVLCYLLFVLPVRATARRGSLAVWLHNVAVLAIILQVIVLYATTGLLKASGSQWTHGTAIYYLSQMEPTWLPYLREAFKQPLVTTGMTYFAVLHQVLFPVAMFSRFKLLWVALGIGFHVGIAVFMGLLTFSTMMIGLELFLLTDAEFATVRAGGHWLRGRLALPRRDDVRAALQASEGS